MGNYSRVTNNFLHKKKPRYPRRPCCALAITNKDLTIKFGVLIKDESEISSISIRDSVGDVGSTGFLCELEGEWETGTSSCIIAIHSGLRGKFALAPSFKVDRLFLQTWSRWMPMESGAGSTYAEYRQVQAMGLDRLLANRGAAFATHLRLLLDRCTSFYCCRPMMTLPIADRSRLLFFAIFIKYVLFLFSFNFYSNSLDKFSIGVIIFFLLKKNWPGFVEGLKRRRAGDQGAGMGWYWTYLVLDTCRIPFLGEDFGKNAVPKGACNRMK